MSSFSGIGLLFWAIMPVTENSDWLYYTCAGLCFLAFSMFIAGSVIVYQEEREKFTTFILGTPRDNIYQIFIALAGIAICYAMNHTNLSCIWWVIIISSLLQLFSPVKEVEKEESTNRLGKGSGQAQE